MPILNFKRNDKLSFENILKLVLKSLLPQILTAVRAYCYITRSTLVTVKNWIFRSGSQIQLQLSICMKKGTWLQSKLFHENLTIFQNIAFQKLKFKVCLIWYSWEKKTENSFSLQGCVILTTAWRRNGNVYWFIWL